MIPKPVEKLLVRIVGKVGREEDKRETKKNPEKCLTAILLTMNERLPSVSAMLDRTVEHSFFGETLDEADRLLRRYRRRKVNGKSRRKKVLSA